MPNHCSGCLSFTHVKREQFDLLYYSLIKEQFCTLVCPPTVEVVNDLENEEKYNKYSDAYRKDFNEGKISKEEYDEQIQRLEKLYPYKQLWYGWRRNHWGTKWGIYDCYITGYNEENGSLDCTFCTAWKELSEDIICKASKLFGCKIEYSWDESGMGFSGVMVAEDGEITSREDYDDAYYGNAHDCSICGCTYGDEDDEMWGDTDEWICLDCIQEQDDNKQ